MEDLDNNQFQPNQLHDIAKNIVAQIGAENEVSHDNEDNDDIVHMMNNSE